MKRWGYWLLVVLAIAALGADRGAGTDVAKLQPIEVLSVTYLDGQIRVQTDTGDEGAGEDLDSAIKNLKDTTPAEVFLETAEYLLIADECKSLLNPLANYLLPSCSVCVLEGEPDLGMVESYLKIHKPTTTLRTFKEGMTRLQILKVNEGRMELVS